MAEHACQSIAVELADTCRWIRELGFAPAHSSNISAKVNDDIWITPTGWSFKDIGAEHIVSVKSDGSVERAPGLRPSSELPMHRKIYELRPDIGAVVHAHPPKATALTVAGHHLEYYLIPEITISLGLVPLVPYELPGTQALADRVGEALKTHEAVLMENHGVVTTGRTLRDAYYNLELIEAFAEIYLLAKQLGTLNEIPPQRVEEIMALKAKMQAAKNG